MPSEGTEMIEEKNAKIEILPEAFSEGLTKEKDLEVKESLLAMQVRFLKHGKKWCIQRFGTAHVEHILISTQAVKSVNFSYHPLEDKPSAPPKRATRSKR